MKMAKLEQKHSVTHTQLTKYKQKFALNLKKKKFFLREIVEGGLQSIPDPRPSPPAPSPASHPLLSSRGSQICQANIKSELDDPNNLQISCPIGWILSYKGAVPYCEKGGPEGYCLTLEAEPQPHPPSRNLTPTVIGGLQKVGRVSQAELRGSV
jgi:hypothetical protein